MKKSKNSTLLRQISQLKLEVARLQDVAYNNADAVKDARFLTDEAVDSDYWRRKYWDLAYTFGVCRDKVWVNRKKERRESKKITSEALTEFELVTSILHESWALDDIYAESLADFMESEYQREWEREQELQERYEEWAESDDVIDPFYFEDDTDDGGPYYGIASLYP